TSIGSEQPEFAPYRDRPHSSRLTPAFATSPPSTDVAMHKTGKGQRSTDPLMHAFVTGRSKPPSALASHLTVAMARDPHNRLSSSVHFPNKYAEPCVGQSGASPMPIRATPCRTRPLPC